MGKSKIITMQVDFPYDFELLKACAEPYVDIRANNEMFSRTLYDYLVKSSFIVMTPSAVAKDIHRIACVEGSEGYLGHYNDSLIGKALRKWSSSITLVSAKKALENWGLGLKVECRMLKDILKEIHPDEDFSDINITPKNKHVTYNAYLAFLPSNEQEVVELVRNGSTLADL
ncbi:hypothetical protein HN924_00110 [Candidatus Woesearchaeota archaeon]|jgi:hypothetical protein|nr:hypothetical protein [Candidatus Woesearchaeota archaeon]MBT7062354.1 hypothetical protein [Candidatus Woesearchaeota archaeon]MBT7402827.1 hypothetical protein [Candidatus Woesearchaeota archaeon]